MGSCFATEMFSWCKTHFMRVTESHFGPLYNPVSVAKSLERLVAKQHVAADEVFEHKGFFKHFDFASHMDDGNCENAVLKMNKAIEHDRLRLLNSDVLVVTLGTAYAYVQKETNQIVANCHKLDQNVFERKLISVREGSERLTETFLLLKRANKNLNIILTLSPIRYLGSDATENSLSKASLRCMIANLTVLPFVEYFGAYEILLDEMRDYRWYKNNLLHPTKDAVAYILTRFIEWKASEELVLYLEDIQPFCKKMNHQVKDSAKKEEWNLSLQKELSSLSRLYPHLKKLVKTLF